MEHSRGILDHSTPILIVDDSEQFAKVLERMLRGGMGYIDVTWVNSCEEAYELIKKENNRFQLMFVDYRLPNGMTGTQLLAKLHEEALLNSVVALLVTSEPTTDNFNAAIAAGAYGIVAKPFDRGELTRQITLAEAARKADNIEYF